MKTFISIFFIVFLLIITSQMKFNIHYLERGKNDFKIRFCANIQIIVLGFIKVFSINLKDDAIYFLWLKIPYKKLLKNNINITNMVKRDFTNSFKALKPNIEEFYFDLKIGIENVIFTTVFIGIVSSVLSWILAKKINNSKRYYYKIMPIYNSNNLYFNFSMKLSISVINIIKTLWLSKNKVNNTHIKPNTVKI